MDQDLEKRLASMEQKIDSIYEATKRARRYAMWRLIFLILLIVGPLIGLTFVIPKYLDTLSVYKML